MSDLPRGLRDCNPLNIRKGPTHWPGEVEGDDPDFRTFDTMTDSIREAGRLLLEYVPVIEGHGKVVCVATIISRWAPAVENDTLAYAQDVAKRLNVSLTHALDLRTPLTLRQLIAAMARHECGAVADQVLTADLLTAGVAGALGPSPLI